jgi:hypothetical protein
VIRQPSSTSQVLGSTPNGSEFLGWVKKNLLASPHVKAQVKTLPSRGYEVLLALLVDVIFYSVIYNEMDFQIYVHAC